MLNIIKPSRVKRSRQDLYGYGQTQMNSVAKTTSKFLAAKVSHVYCFNHNCAFVLAPQPRLPPLYALPRVVTTPCQRTKLSCQKFNARVVYSQRLQLVPQRLWKISAKFLPFHGTSRCEDSGEESVRTDRDHGSSRQGYALLGWWWRHHILHHLFNGCCRK